MTEFKPCPICGRRLTWEDVFFADECGEECSEEIARYVDIMCTCGFNYCVDVDDINYLLDGWQEKFVPIANRRWTKDVSKEEYDRFRKDLEEAFAEKVSE